MKKSTTTIEVIPPYDFFVSIHSHRNKKYHFDQYDRSNGIYKKAYEFGGKAVLAEITAKGGLRKPSLAIALHGKSLNEETVTAVTQQIQRQFLTKMDVRPFYKSVSQDKVLSGLTKQFYGLKPNWPGDLFECLTRCIISQQINVTFADKVEMNFVQKFGKKIIHDGESFFVFPDIYSVSQLRKRDLLKIQFSERKAEYLIDIARDAASGNLDLNKLASLPAEKFREEITKIRGVGAWTAECCMMHLGHRNVLPRGDIGLHQAIRQFYGIEKDIRLEKLLTVADQWKGWESFATYYLWHALTHERMKKRDS